MRDEGHGVGQAREGGGLVVRHAHPAAQRHDPARRLPDEAQVVGQHVGRIVVGVDQGDLELPRQVGAAIQLVLRLAGHGFAAQEDLVMGAGLRQQPVGQGEGLALQQGMDGVAARGGGGDDVTHHVAAGGQRGHQRAMDAGNGAAQVFPQHAVELHALAGGQAQRAVGVAVGQGVQRQPLRRGQPPGRGADAHHEGPVLVLAGLLAGGGGVAVVLLIGAVKLQQGIAGLAQPALGMGGVQLGRDGAAQAAAVQLDAFGWGKFHRRALAQSACQE